MIRCPSIPMWQSLGAGLAVLFLSTLQSPACARADEPTHCVNPDGDAGIKSARETSAIYSLLLAKNTDLPERSAWEAARTIREECAKHALDPMLVLALIEVESQFRHRAISTRGARGLMQLLPAVAAALVADAAPGVWQGENSLDDPVINIKLGVFYFAQLQDRFRDSAIALTAYNRGPTWVQTNLEKKLALPLAYARKVLSISYDYRQRGRSTDFRPETGKIAAGDGMYGKLSWSRNYA